MNVRRFIAKSSREAMAQVRAAFGEDAIVLSTKPGVDGVEMLAMAPEAAQQIEQLAAKAPAAPAPAAASSRGSAPAGSTTGEAQRDAEELSMSTLSFQDYVRQRMLRRRQAAIAQREGDSVSGADTQPDSRFDDAAAYVSAHEPLAPAPAPKRPRSEQPAKPARHALGGRTPVLADDPLGLGSQAQAPMQAPSPAAEPIRVAPERHGQAEARAWAAVSPSAATAPAAPAGGSVPAQLLERARQDQQAMMAELRSMRGLIEERFGALAFLEKMQRQPAHARLAQRLLDAGFSPALIRKLADGMGQDIGDETAWVSSVLERNLITGEEEAAIEDQGGVYAMIGSTGVGKTTTTAKLAAAFATKHGAAHLGLITLDAYRIAAHEQLRAYGRILGVPVHTAHDRASLEDLLELLSGKRLVLIDTAGIGQRDARTRELLDMLAHRSIKKLLVVNSAAQGETTEDVMHAYRAPQCAGVILSKLDEALKLGPALDALIRHRLKVVGVANGQRVPEDWHRLSAQALVHRALRPVGAPAYRLEPQDVNLVFTASHAAASHASLDA